MFVYIRSAAFVSVVTQKLVLQQSINVTAKCSETLSPLLLFNISLVQSKVHSLYTSKFLNMYTIHVIHCILYTLYAAYCTRCTTLYTLSCMCRQKREKALREKKDAMINKMAAEQKKKMAEGRKVNQNKGIVDIT